MHSLAKLWLQRWLVELCQCVQCGSGYIFHFSFWQTFFSVAVSFFSLAGNGHVKLLFLFLVYHLQCCVYYTKSAMYEQVSIVKMEIINRILIFNEFSPGNCMFNIVYNTGCTVLSAHLTFKQPYFWFNLPVCPVNITKKTGTSLHRFSTN